jgi:hypothetical protein
MTNESPVAFAAILSSIALFVWLLIHATTGLYGGPYAFVDRSVDPSCSVALDPCTW